MTRPAALQIIAPSDWRAQPWKNGRGITNEIARWPEVGDYDVRISIADDTEDGPFSTFPGYRRWSVLAGDNPIVLNGVRLARRSDLFEIDGAGAIEAHLPSGPTRLFNILARVPVEVGVGVTLIPIDFAFAIDATPELAEDHAIHFATPTRFASGSVAWLRFAG